MQTASFKFITIAIPVLLAGAGIVRSAPDGQQPRMATAEQLLRDALVVPTPLALPLLTAAKEELDMAQHDKGGFRVQAIASVEKSIAEAQAGEKAKMTEDIKTALLDVQNGMTVAP